MNWTTILAGVQSALATAKEFAPLLTLAGPVGATAATVIGNAAGLAQSVLATATAVAGTENAAPSETLAQLEASNAEAQLLNDAAAELIAAS